MQNINAFRQVVHGKKIFKIHQHFSYFSPYWAPKGARPFYLNKYDSPSPKHVSHQVWLKLAKQIMRRKYLKVFAT